MNSMKSRLDELLRSGYTGGYLPVESIQSPICGVAQDKDIALVLLDEHDFIVCEPSGCKYRIVDAFDMANLIYELAPQIQRVRRLANVGWNDLVDCAIIIDDDQPSWLTTAIYLFVKPLMDRCNLRTIKPNALKKPTVSEKLKMNVEPFNTDIEYTVEVSLG